MKAIDEAILIVFSIIILIACGFFGWCLSERQHCKKDGGYYSMDFNECIQIKGIK